MGKYLAVKTPAKSAFHQPYLDYRVDSGMTKTGELKLADSVCVSDIINYKYIH